MRKILVLEGGFNEEHEVSLNTSKEIQKSLERMKFDYEVMQVNPINFSGFVITLTRFGLFKLIGKNLTNGKFDRRILGCHHLHRGECSYFCWSKSFI